jgi:hypothetical protein
MSAYRDWVAQVKSLGGVATAWPFDDDDYGTLAARFDVNTYTRVFNSGRLPTGEGTQSTVNGQYVYVLASALTDSDAADHSAADLAKPTSAEEAAARKRLLAQWGLPDTDDVTRMLKTIAVIAGIALAWTVVVPHLGGSREWR